MGVEATPLPPLRNGLPQIRFDPAFDPTPDTILDLIERIERDSNFGPPLFIPVETRTWADQQAAAGYARVENIISALVQESLMRQRIWPTQNGFPQFLRRSSDDTVITLELVNKLRDDE